MKQYKIYITVLYLNHEILLKYLDIDNELNFESLLGDNYWLLALIYGSYLMYNYLLVD